MDAVRRLNAFLEKYAAECEARGDAKKADLVRREMIPTILMPYGGSYGG